MSHTMKPFIGTVLDEGCSVVETHCEGFNKPNSIGERIPAASVEPTPCGARSVYQLTTQTQNLPLRKGRDWFPILRKVRRGLIVTLHV